MWSEALKQIEQEPDKKCNTCLETLPAVAFHKRRNRNGKMERRAQCRVCWHKARGTEGKRCRNG